MVHIGLFNVDVFLRPKLDLKILPKWAQHRTQEAPKLASRWLMVFKLLREADFFGNYRFSDLNLGANMGQKTCHS